MSVEPTTDLVGTRVGRVRVEALLGTGGMGEVYQGWDEALERPVALKKLRHDKRTTPLDEERFLREARLLSRLDHRNVCRIYDLIEDPRGRFLVLELIRGRTLEELLDEGGLALRRRLEIGRQVAAGLAAAHREHIVHRDVKPQNVMITDDGQVKLLDLGIARPALDPLPDAADVPTERLAAEGSVEDSATGATAFDVPRRLAKALPPCSGPASHTSFGTVVGTALFMSPEQARGEVLTEASDQYSLGLLLQVLLCSAPPHPPGLGPLELLDRVAAAESEGARGADPAVCRLIERLKSPLPSDRPSAEEAEALIARLLDRPRRRRAVVVAGATLAVVAGGTAWLTGWLTRPQPLLPPAGGRVAVAPFVNGTGDPGNDWVELGLSGMLAEALDGSAAEVAIVPPTEVRRTLGEREPALGLPGAELRPLVERLDVAVLLVGEVEASGGGYRLRWALLDRSSPKSIEEVEGAELTRVGEQLAALVAARLRPGGTLAERGRTFSRDVFANRAYATGKQLFETDGARRAEPYFEVAIDRDGALLPAQLMLGACRQQLGQVDDARLLLERVAGQADDAGDLGVRAEALYQLAGLAMGRTDHAAAKTALEEALALVRERGDRARQHKVENQLGVLAYRLGDMAEAERLWSAVAGAAAGDGDRRLEMTTSRNLGYVSVRLGDRQGAGDRFRRSLELARQLEDRDGVAYALGSLGFLAVDEGDFAAAAEHFREASEISEETGNRRGQLTGLANLATATFSLGDLAGAEEYERRSLEISRQLDDRRVQAQSLAALGYYASRRGRMVEAESLLAEATAVVADVDDDPAGRWLLDRNLAVLRALQGRIGEARRHLAAARQHRQNKLVLVAAALVEYQAGDVEAAIRLQEEAKEAGGVGWTEADQRRLDFYREADREGRRRPLPVDPQ